LTLDSTIGYCYSNTSTPRSIFGSGF